MDRGYFAAGLLVFLTLYIIQSEGVCNVPNFVTIKENVAGNILNNSITSDVTFTWDITEVSGIPFHNLNYEQKQKIQEYFSSSRNNVTVLINVVKVLDKESLIVTIGIIVTNIKMRVTCDKDITDMTVIVESVNEFPPEFGKSYYQINVSETTTVNSVVYTINDVDDRDVDESEVRTFSVSRDLPEFDGTPYFTMESGSSPNIVLSQTLDYDAIVAAGKVPIYLVRVEVRDDGGRTDSALFNFTIINEDDLPPAFVPGCETSHACTYISVVNTGHIGPLTNITPGVVNAADMDKQHSVIYSIVPDSAGYNNGFTIDANTGVLSARFPILETGVLNIKATENSGSPNPKSARANMLVQIASNQPSNSTSGRQPTVGKSTADDSDDMLTIIIVVAVLAVLVIVALIVVLIFYCKRQKKKSVKPGDGHSSTSQEALNAEKELSSSKQELLQSYSLFMTTPEGKGNQLPPIGKVDMMTGTDEFKKRSRRRKKKELEIFDGTREYQMEADIDFFKQGSKSKIKRSTRSIKDQKLDPKYWITVRDGYLE